MIFIESVEMTLALLLLANGDEYLPTFLSRQPGFATWDEIM